MNDYKTLCDTVRQLLKRAYWDTSVPDYILADLSDAIGGFEGGVELSEDE